MLCDKQQACSVTQPHPTLCNPWTIAHQAPLSVHGILQARILAWVAIPFLKGIFPTQGLNLHPLHWQANSLPQATWEVPVMGIQASEELCNPCYKKRRLKEVYWRNSWTGTSHQPLPQHMTISNSFCFLSKKKRHRDFPGDPVVGTPRFHCRGTGSTPGQGTKTLHATQHYQKEKNDTGWLWAYFKGKNASFSKVTGILIKEKIYVNKTWLSAPWGPQKLYCTQAKTRKKPHHLLSLRINDLESKPITLKIQPKSLMR